MDTVTVERCSSRTRMDIGNQRKRWLALKAVLGLWRNEEVAKLLLDSWSVINGISLDPEDDEENSMRDGSSDTEGHKEEKELVISGEDEYEDLPILERPLEDWEMSSWLKTTDKTEPESHPTDPVPLQSCMKSSVLPHHLKVSPQQSHQPSQKQTSSNVIKDSKTNQVKDSHNKQKSQLIKIPHKEQLQSFQGQGAVPGQKGISTPLLFFPRIGEKPLLVFPATYLGSNSMATAGGMIPLTVNGSTSNVTTVNNTVNNNPASLAAPVIHMSRTSVGNCVPVKSTGSILQHSNIVEQVACADGDTKKIKVEGQKCGPLSDEPVPVIHLSRTSVGNCVPVKSTGSVLQHSNIIEQVAGADGDHDTTEIAIDGQKFEPVSDEVLNNKVNTVTQVIQDSVNPALTSDTGRVKEPDDVVLNLYCSSGDDADDDQDDDDDDDNEIYTHILKPSRLTSVSNKTKKKHTPPKLDDTARKNIKPSPRKENLESSESDSVQSFRSERLRKKGRISFVELMKGNVVFGKGKNGKIFAKERETSTKGKSSEKFEHSKKGNTTVSASVDQRRKYKSVKIETGIDDGSSLDTDSEGERYFDSDSDFDPCVSTNVNFQTKKQLKRKFQPESDQSGGEHNRPKKLKMSDRVVSFGGS